VGESFRSRRRLEIQGEVNPMDLASPSDSSEGGLMTVTTGAVVTVVQPGGGDSVSIPGFGAVFKLTSRNTGGHVAIVEHPFAEARSPLHTGTLTKTSTRS
jgi:hypothetical protein